MDKHQLATAFLKFLPQEAVLLDEPMKNHTTFKIGGPADIMVLPRTPEEVQEVVKICRATGAPFFVMGNGSNLLVRDKGLRQVVLKIGPAFNQVTFEGTKVIAQSGILLSTLANLILKQELTGFEFASGIPGSLGGAIAMNAGAYGGEMKDIITRCTVVTPQGELLELEDLEMGYRTSIVQREGYIAISAELALAKGVYSEIKAKMDDLTLQRTTKQPLQYPSAGSVFKRPPGYFAGKLIQDCGMKGARIGDAQVSELHSGFIINRGNATAQEVLDLIHWIQQEVKKTFGVELQTEIKIIGEE